MACETVDWRDLAVRPGETLKDTYARLYLDMRAALRERRGLPEGDDRRAGLRRQARRCLALMFVAVELAAGDPEYAADLDCWMVLAQGPWRAGSEAVMAFLAGRASATAEEARERVGELAGELPALVQSALARWDHYGHPQMCVHSWSLGVYCSPADADRVCALLHRQFADELRGNELAVRRVFCGFRFPDLATPGLARRWLKRRQLLL